jgi:hypothetical protein
MTPSLLWINTRMLVRLNICFLVGFLPLVDEITIFTSKKKHIQQEWLKPPLVEKHCFLEQKASLA